MPLVRPRFFFPPVALPPDAPVRFNAIGFVAPTTLGGDAGLAFPAVPFTIVSGATSYSNVVHVAGLRSFQIALRLSAGPGTLELHPCVISPSDAVTISSEDNFATLTLADGLKAFGWGASAGNGGGGGGVTTGGLDGRIYTHTKIGLKAVGGNVTVDRLDGLWCAAV